MARFGRLTGVDLGFVPVTRSPAAGAGSAERGARAFTAGGVVNLPEDAGPMDRADAEALVAHELTHVLHQRTLGPAAREDGPLGHALEAHADAVERAFRGEPAVPAGVEPPADAGFEPTYVTWTPETGFVEPLAVGGVSPPATETAPIQRAPVTWRPAAEDRSPPSTQPPEHPVAADEAQPLRYPGEPPGAELEAAEPRAEDAPAPAPFEISDDDLARIAERLHSAAATPQLDPRDPVLLDSLATGLYGRLRSRLRSELIADRERAGRLTEFT